MIAGIIIIIGAHRAPLQFGLRGGEDRRLNAEKKTVHGLTRMRRAGQASAGDGIQPLSGLEMALGMMTQGRPENRPTAGLSDGIPSGFTEDGTGHEAARFNAETQRTRRNAKGRGGRAR